MRAVLSVVALLVVSVGAATAGLFSRKGWSCAATACYVKRLRGYWSAEARLAGASP